METLLHKRLRINVDVFEGPLDLLLYLIKKDELDIYDIPIAHITEEYLAYLEMFEELNLDLAGEFLLMAATLTQIKSRMLLPRPEGTGEVIEEDPRAELVRRLLEYQRYKEASLALEEQEILDFDVFTHPYVEEKLEPVPLAEEAVETTLYELVSALKLILEKLPEKKYHEIIRETVSISQRIYQMIELLRGRERVEFSQLFQDAETRPLVIITFLSLLELMKLKMVQCEQVARGGEIHILPTGDFSTLNGVEVDDYETKNTLDGAEG
jgi:segregation and condensation protein A